MNQQGGNICGNVNPIRLQLFDIFLMKNYI